MMAKKLLPILLATIITIPLMAYPTTTTAIWPPMITWPPWEDAQPGQYPDYGCPAFPNGEFIGYTVKVWSPTGSKPETCVADWAVSYHGEYVDGLIKSYSVWYKKNEWFLDVHLWFKVHPDEPWDTLYIAYAIGADVKGKHQYACITITVWNYTGQYALCTDLIPLFGDHKEYEPGYVYRAGHKIIEPDDWLIKPDSTQFPLPAGDYIIEVTVSLKSQTQTVFPTWHWVDAYGSEYGSVDGYYVHINVINVYDG